MPFRITLPPILQEYVLRSRLNSKKPLRFYTSITDKHQQTKLINFSNYTYPWTNSYCTNPTHSKQTIYAPNHS